MNRKGSFLNGKGFYIALTVIIAGAALASFLAINSMMGTFNKTDNTKEDKQWGFEDTQVEKKQDNVKVPSKPSSVSQSTAPSSTAQYDSPKAQPELLKPQAPPTPSYVLPTSGAVMASFSADELVYNTTMGDWRTHNGTDIAAAANAEVIAPMGASVAKAYYDDMWGGVVELNDGTITLRVMGLSKTLRVKEGDTVIQGAILGNAGEVNAENAAEGHIHVEMEKDGVLINPEEYLK